MVSGRSWRIKRKVIWGYNRLAPIYNALYAHEQTQKIKRVLYALDFSPPETILDVGCGTGLLFKHISDSAGMLIGVDIAREPLKIAKKLIKDSGIDRTFLVLADADFLPFKSGVFDKVFAITLLQNMPDPVLTLNEISRVAKEDAAIIITGLKKVFSREFFSELLWKAGFNFTLLEGEDDVKCHIAICCKGDPAKNINKREMKIIA
ncbi:MAG: class I SAM-dependent methyltransferase [Candidatus Bathyarchaeia archaeon]|nr:methyltransferase domain-containing protein [Candidatus Bathyarchaeota archaeon]